MTSSSTIKVFDNSSQWPILLIFSEIIKNNANSLKMVEGEFEVNTQYHFYMETQTVLARPSEKGQIDMVSATQWLENTQRMVAQALGKAENLINVQVRRVGGAYGGKTRITGHVAAATAVAATKLNRPVR